MYSLRVERAVTTMLEAHGLVRRKAGRGFEASHALAVAMIVSDFGFDEDTVIAAVLHDTLEDTSLEPAVIKQQFGPLVLAIVQDVSEPPHGHAWRDRKLRYIEQLRDSPRFGARAVAAADKIHNLSKMTTGLVDHGENYVRPFTARLDDMLWYHATVLDTLRRGWQHVILEEQTRRYTEFQEACRVVSTAPGTG